MPERKIELKIFLKNFPKRGQVDEEIRLNSALRCRLPRICGRRLRIFKKKFVPKKQKLSKHQPKFDNFSFRENNFFRPVPSPPSPLREVSKNVGSLIFFPFAEKPASKKLTVISKTLPLLCFP